MKRLESDHRPILTFTNKFREVMRKKKKELMLMFISKRTRGLFWNMAIGIVTRGLVVRQADVCRRRFIYR